MRSPLDHSLLVPPGPPPVTAHPLSLFRYARRMRHGIAVVGERFEEYGDIYYAPFLGRHVYVLRDPEHIKEALLTSGPKLGKPVRGVTARLLRRFLGEGLLNSNGETWRRHRRLIQPAFGPEPIARYAEVMASHAAEAAAGFRDGETLDVSTAMMELTLRIVAKTLFDHRVTSETDDVASAMRVFRGAFGGPDVFLPSWVPTPSRRRTDAALERIDALVYGLIDARRTRGLGEDLLSRLIAASDAASEGDRLDRKQLRDEVLTLFLAGHETTSHALSWAFHLLARSPEAEARLHRELDEVLGDRPPTPDDLPALPYTEQVLMETMRLRPPAYVITRVAEEALTLGGFHVPQGADVVIWIYHVHRDPRFYPDPERFDPERFRPERLRALPPCAYLPFGAGSRTCIGKRFAMVEAQLLLATLAREVRLRPVAGHRVEMDAAVTLAPKGGLPMIVERRARSPRAALEARA